MLRDKDILEISDGRLYGLNDMARLGCNDCQGCSACCHGMGESILLDPRDTANLTLATGRLFTELLDQEVELHVVDGMILPNLKLAGDGESCRFLTPEGRCSIHLLRPGICRIFPLGRYYHDDTFSYILQTGECHARNRYKVRIRQWIDVPNPVVYDRYILDWHRFTRECAARIAGMDEVTRKDVVMYLLRLFYLKDYDPDTDFYEQFYTRLSAARRYLG